MQDKSLEEVPAQAGADTAAALKIAKQFLLRGRPGEAEKIYKELFLRQPDNASVLFNLGLLASRRGAHPEAAKFFERLLILDPRDADAMAALAVTKIELGMVEEAHELGSRAIMGQISVPALAQLGTMYGETGDKEKSLDCLRRALARNPADINSLCLLASYTSLEAEDPAFVALQEIAASPALLDANMKSRVHFALGKAHMEQGDAEAAFSHYQSANDLKKSTYAQYDVAQQERYIDSIISLFDGPFVRRLQGAVEAAAGESPIFVVGMPRSGSTLVDQILSSHPKVRSIGEAKAVLAAVPYFENSGYSGLFAQREPSMSPGLAAALSPDLLKAVQDRYITLCRYNPKGDGKVVDKMLGNFMFLGLLRLAMPQAKFIHCMRHPADIGLSIWGIMFTHDIPWAYCQQDIARYYLAEEKLMAHWKNIFPGLIHEVSYESTIEDQEGETRKLLEYCGLPWDTRCLDFHMTRRVVKTASVMQVRQPLYKGSAGKWKKHEKYLTKLLATLKNGAAS